MVAGFKIYTSMFIDWKTSENHVIPYCDERRLKSDIHSMSVSTVLFSGREPRNDPP